MACITLLSQLPHLHKINNVIASQHMSKKSNSFDQGLIGGGGGGGGRAGALVLTTKLVMSCLSFLGLVQSVIYCTLIEE